MSFPCFGLLSGCPFAARRLRLANAHPQTIGSIQNKDSAAERCLAVALVRFGLRGRELSRRAHQSHRSRALEFRRPDADRGYKLAARWLASLSEFGFRRFAREQPWCPAAGRSKEGRLPLCDWHSPLDLRRSRRGRPAAIQEGSFHRRPGGARWKLLLAQMQCAFYIAPWKVWVTWPWGGFECTKTTELLRRHSRISECRLFALEGLMV